MTKDIYKLFLEKGFLLDKDMLEFFKELENEEIAKDIINKIAIVSKKKIITKNLITENFEKIKPVLFELDSEKQKLIEKYFINIKISVELKKEISIDNDITKKSANFKILSSPLIASQKIEVKDFVRYFRSRYNLLKNMLQQRTELENLTSIDKISSSFSNRTFSIIGIVSDKIITKNKNIVLEVEDLTGKAKLLINQNRENVFEKSKEILLDDVIGFKCSGTKDFVFVNDLFYPDCYKQEKIKINDEIYAVFISDIHVGSKNFLKNNFNKFIDWLCAKNLDLESKKIVQKIKYMFVVGDTIDGVGVYPGQEKDLEIKDIKKQYEVLAEYYNKIPRAINIIQCPGQHDAVRVAEPQPPVGNDFGEALHKIPNLYLVSNPSMIEICTTENKEGLKVLMYHGASMHALVNEIEELRLINAHHFPAKVVKHLLLRRHLAPIHGQMIYIPDSNEDPLVIKEVPDIITTGDLHRPDVDKYNDTLILCNSCFQSITAFEEKVGNKPDPCKVILLNLKTREVKIIDFSDEENIIKKEICTLVNNKASGNFDEKQIVCRKQE
jgi:DNA polymerase II small subunit